MKFKLFIIFVLICLSCPAWAATYYVKNGGNDSLDGLSDSTAWATIAKVEATVGSGDVVYFRSQDTWTNASRGAVLVPTAGVKYFGTGYGSGTRAKFLAGRSASGGYYGVIDINVSNVTVSGFEVDGNYASNSYNNDGIAASWSGGNISGITIDNCVVHNTGLPHGGWGHGIIVTNYTQHTTRNVVLTNNTVYDTAKGGIFLYASWTSANNVVDTVLVRNNTVYNGGTGPNIEVCNDIRNATIEFNNIHDSISGYSGLNVRTSSDPGVARGKPTNLIIRYNLIYNNSGRGIDFWPNYYAQDITADVYGNLFYNNGRGNTACDGASINISNDAGYPSWGNSVLNFYNNTIYDTNSGCTNSRYGISLGVWGTSLSGTPTIKFKNNIIYTGNFTAFYDGHGWLSSDDHSNNLIYRSSAGTLVRSGSTNYTSANISTWEATSQVTNPTFTGGTLPTGFSGTYGSNMVPNTDYFQLTVDSPAKDAGATLASYTGSINGAGLTTPIVRPLGAAFDIGAYEYGTVAQTGGSAGSGFKMQGTAINSQGAASCSASTDYVGDKSDYSAVSATQATGNYLHCLPYQATTTSCASGTLGKGYLAHHGTDTENAKICVYTDSTSGTGAPNNETKVACSGVITCAEDTPTPTCTDGNNIGGSVTKDAYYFVCFVGDGTTFYYHRDTSGSRTLYAKDFTSGYTSPPDTLTASDWTSVASRDVGVYVEIY